LLAALKRSGILFKSLLVNQVIAASTDCTYCAAVAADHENELREYRRAFSDLEVLVLLRWPGALRGGDALAGLLRFASPDGVPLGEPDRIIKEQIQLTT
jgi:anion-transporting  ArsA/GET3 family ATPase